MKKQGEGNQELVKSLETVGFSSTVASEKPARDSHQSLSKTQWGQESEVFTYWLWLPKGFRVALRVLTAPPTPDSPA